MLWNPISIAAPCTGAKNSRSPTDKAMIACVVDVTSTRWSPCRSTTHDVDFLVLRHPAKLASTLAVKVLC
eukprot:416434-Prorocentrum_lima.AAC.1